MMYVGLHLLVRHLRKCYETVNAPTSILPTKDDDIFNEFFLFYDDILKEFSDPLSSVTWKSFLKVTSVYRCVTLELWS